MKKKNNGQIIQIMNAILNSETNLINDLRPDT